MLQQFKNCIQMLYANQKPYFSVKCSIVLKTERLSNMENECQIKNTSLAVSSPLTHLLLNQ